MNRSFRRLLILFLVGMAIVPPLVLTYPFTLLVSNIVEKNAARETALLAERVAHDLRGDLRMLVSQALALSRDSDIQRGTRSILFSEKAEFLMRRFLGDNPLSGAAYLLDENFRLKSEVSGGDNLAAERASMRATLEEAKRTFRGEILESHGYYRYFGGKGFFALAIPVTGPLERRTGLLLITLPFEKVRSAVAARVEQPAFARLLIEGFDEPIQVDLTVGFRHEVPVLISGFEAGGEFPAKIEVLEPKAIRLGAVRKRIWGMILSSTFLALLAGISGYYLALRLNRPFKRLNEHLQKYEEGDYSAKLPSFRMDEFRLIADTLGSMAGKIRAQIQLAAENERARGEMERTRLETELHSLHQQMQPHFLFNTLNSIGTMIHLDADRAARMVNLFSDLYRLILEMNKTNTVRVEKELTVVSHYLELQAMRFGDRLRYSIDCQPEVRGLHVPGLMLQTLVENAVKHGIAKSREGGEIQVRVLSAGNEHYKCEIRNTGGPLLDGVTGTGLANTRRRLALLYGDKHAFSLQTGDSGETVASFYFSGKAS